MDALTLFVDHHFISPYAMSAFVALEEKGLPYALRIVRLPTGEQKQASYGARTKRVPSLQHGDYWLAESQAIAEYLAEVFPFPDHPRLFPADLKQRGICREIMSWVRSDLGPIREERGTDTIWYDAERKPLSTAAVTSRARLIAFADGLLGARSTLFDAWCIADADLAMMLRRLRHDNLPKGLAAYVDANWQRPPLAKWDALTRPPYEAY